MTELTTYDVIDWNDSGLTATIRAYFVGDVPRTFQLSLIDCGFTIPEEVFVRADSLQQLTIEGSEAIEGAIRSLYFLDVQKALHQENQEIKTTMDVFCSLVFEKSSDPILRDYAKAITETWSLSHQS